MLRLTQGRAHYDGQSLEPRMRALTGTALALHLALAFFLTATVSLAQETPTADIAVEYSHLQVLKGYTISMNGASESFAYNFSPWFAMVTDLGAYHGYPAQSLTGETYTTGPRFTYRGFAHFQPFAHGLFGGSHFNVSSGGITGGGLQLAFAGGFGADIMPRSSARFAVRLQDDYFATRSGGANTVSNRLSAGVVLRLGQR